MAKPEGKNELGTRRLFEERKYYKEEILKPEDELPTRLVDYWYERPWYGRISLDGRTIALQDRDNIIMPVPPGKIYTLDFVAAAYKDFVDFHRQTPGLTTLDVFGTVTPVNGLKPSSHPTKIYNDLVEKLYENFFGVYADRLNLLGKITNFDIFFDIFGNFLLGMAASGVPITKSALMRSKYCDPRSSGLVLSFSDQGKHGDDIVKWKKMQSKNFNAFKNAAKRHGFVLDKNAPWRLIANLKHPRLRTKAQSFGSYTERQIYNNYYEETCIQDLPLLKEMPFSFYDSYISSRNTHVTKVKSQGKLWEPTVICRVERKKITESEIEEKLSFRFWCGFYFKLRIAEEGLQGYITRQDYKKTLQDIESLLAKKTIDKRTVMLYIDDSIRNKVSKYRRQVEIDRTKVADISSAGEIAAAAETLSVAAESEEFVYTTGPMSYETTSGY